ncbi:hypothetical protein MLD38_002992 [Melastoma candidum]|uniref:Uncharacterized protein n=1 Tax=Melastoma candidum TaxID=119954 RepID=A0ACB9S9Q7_9MYRT|nr:hypothetical protein MLD38_002992 [Melastoma candidum]
MAIDVRRHGWQPPLHPLQIVGMAVFSFLVVAFYLFLGLFLGSRIAEIVMVTLFSSVALLAVLLFIRCTATDPTDKTSFKKNKKKTSGCKGLQKLNYGYVLAQVITRFFRRLEKKILRSVIRRKYLDPLSTSSYMEPLLPFPLITKDDVILPDLNEVDVTFCSLCNFEVKKHSKHCRTCNRCVEGFDHHCRWLNNCIGKKNYTTFILLMVSVLLMLVIEGGTGIAVFILCFVDKKGMERELSRKFHVEFPRGLLATIAFFLVLLTAYSTAALGQLFFFHLVLIRKGMRTYDYILAMREGRTLDLDQSDESDSDDSLDYSPPEKSSLMSRLKCNRSSLNQDSRVSVKIDRDPGLLSSTRKDGFIHVGINPWKLLKLSKEKALLAADRARERLLNQKPPVKNENLQEQPKADSTANQDKDKATVITGLSPLISKGIIPGSAGHFPSPRRRLSGIMASPKRYKSSLDVTSLENHYASIQVLSSAMKMEETEAIPR